MANEQGKQEELLTQLVEKLIQCPFKTVTAKQNEASDGEKQKAVSWQKRNLISNETDLPSKRQKFKKTEKNASWPEKETHQMGTNDNHVVSAPDKMHRPKKLEWTNFVQTCWRANRPVLAAQIETMWKKMKIWICPKE